MGQTWLPGEEHETKSPSGASGGAEKRDGSGSGSDGGIGIHGNQDGEEND